MQYKHHANLLLSMNNYALLVISRNDKNKRLTLLCQRKLASTAINRLLALWYTIIEAPTNFKKPSASLN